MIRVGPRKGMGPDPLKREKIKDRKSIKKEVRTNEVYI